MAEILWVIDDSLPGYVKVYLRRVYIALGELLADELSTVFVSRLKELSRRKFDLVHFWWTSRRISARISVYTPCPPKGYVGTSKWYVADTSRLEMWLRAMGVHPHRIFSIHRTELEPAEFAAALVLVYDYLMGLREVK